MIPARLSHVSYRLISAYGVLILTSLEINIRAFKWSDTALLATLQHAEESDVYRWLKQSNLIPEQECVFAEIGDEPVGFGYLIAEQTLSRGVLIADAANPAVMAALIADSGNRAQNLGLSLIQMDVPESDLQRRELCKAAGMSLVRTHLHLLRPGNEPTNTRLPFGTTTRLATRADVSTITDIQNKAFIGSWGYAPNSAEEVSYRIFELPAMAPDPVIIISVDSEDLGYCWAHQEHADTPSIIGMVGVLPSQQGKGLGKLATAAGIDHLLNAGAAAVEITVDSENGPAIQVYETVGFRLNWRSMWYERALS